MAKQSPDSKIQPPDSTFQFYQGEAGIHKLMLWLRKHHTDKAIIGYPNTKGEYDTTLTGDDLERITAYTAAKYAEAFRALPGGGVTGELGFGKLTTKIVAMVNISTLGNYMTYLALHRLGFTPMAISPRLAASGYAHLLRQTGCHCVVAGGASLDTLRAVKADYDGPLEVVPMLEDDEVIGGLTAPRVVLSEPDGFPDTILHTGGTTGLPKPVPLKMHQWLNNLVMISGGRQPGLCTLPLFHSYGMGTFLRSLRTATPCYLLNPYRPVTASIIWKALDDTKAKYLYTVPYVIKFFADMDGGVERLAQLSMVRSGGSALPDELGNALIKAGANLQKVYGLTEVGAPMTMYGSGLDEWSWMTPMPAHQEHIKFEKVGDNLYHLVILSTYPGLRVSDRPDGSYGTKDLFKPHPDNLPGNDRRAGKARWKFVARQGDILVLVNGENADPTPVEKAVMLEPTVQMAVAFGAGRERLGLVVIPSEKATGMSAEEVIESIQPALDRGNKEATEYARISADDIVVMPVGTEYPQTAKMTLQRPVLNALFAKDIDAHYAAREGVNDNVKMSDEDVRATVRRIVEKEFMDKNGEDAAKFDDDCDFFNLGMDSLQSSLVRTRLQREIPFPGRGSLATNVVFEYPTVNLLTEHLLALRRPNEKSSVARDPEAIANALVEKYSALVTFAPPSCSVAKPAAENGASGHCIVLTGATGYIGAQLLSSLLHRSDVSFVYSLVRTHQAHDHDAAGARIRTALDDSQLTSTLTTSHLAKLRAWSADLAAPDLGLSSAEYTEVSTAVTAVIHNAWSVNFNMGLTSFEPNVASVAHLLNLARSAPQPRKTTFVFVSSVASVGGGNAREGGPVEERIYGWNEATPARGYGQSKWVSEHICAAAAAPQSCDGLGAVRVLRVGQVSGDTKNGIWNPAEAIPAVVQSALTIGALPQMEDEQRNVLRWLPSDATAAAIIDLSLLQMAEPLAVFHVANPQTLKWNEHVLPAMAKAGIKFRAVPQREWVRLLGESEKDIEKNPPYKLIEHFKQTYGVSREHKSSQGSSKDAVSRLDLKKSLNASFSLESAPRVENSLLVRYGQFWLKYWAQKT